MFEFEDFSAATFLERKDGNEPWKKCLQNTEKFFMSSTRNTTNELVIENNEQDDTAKENNDRDY